MIGPGGGTPCQRCSNPFCRWQLCKNSPNPGNVNQLFASCIDCGWFGWQRDIILQQQRILDSMDSNSALDPPHSHSFGHHTRSRSRLQELADVATAALAAQASTAVSHMTLPGSSSSLRPPPSRSRGQGSGSGTITRCPECQQAGNKKCPRNLCAKDCTSGQGYLNWGCRVHLVSAIQSRSSTTVPLDHPSTVTPSSVPPPRPSSSVTPSSVPPPRPSSSISPTLPPAPVHNAITSPSAAPPLPSIPSNITPRPVVHARPLVYFDEERTGSDGEDSQTKEIMLFYWSGPECPNPMEVTVPIQRQSALLSRSMLDRLHIADSLCYYRKGAGFWLQLSQPPNKPITIDLAKNKFIIDGTPVILLKDSSVSDCKGLDQILLGKSPKPPSAASGIFDLEKVDLNTQKPPSARRKTVQDMLSSLEITAINQHLAQASSKENDPPPYSSQPAKPSSSKRPASSSPQSANSSDSSTRNSSIPSVRPPVKKAKAVKSKPSLPSNTVIIIHDSDTDPELDSEIRPSSSRPLTSSKGKERAIQGVKEESTEDDDEDQQEFDEQWDDFDDFEEEEDAIRFLGSGPGKGFPQQYHAVTIVAFFDALENYDGPKTPGWRKAIFDQYFTGYDRYPSSSVAAHQDRWKQVPQDYKDEMIDAGLTAGGRWIRLMRNTREKNQAKRTTRRRLKRHVERSAKRSGLASSPLKRSSGKKRASTALKKEPSSVGSWL
ncbi:hypothetical protein VNI00_016686 [Paramarasmius palmivorus]|uniref:Uncharacterized protein n=1 Tax=Paramarasmius palmivorus TaxID=297713 RepID=A0AAW0BB10_9AGAR